MKVTTCLVELEKLKSGMPVLATAGKRCGNTGLKRAYKTPVGIVICPGCNRECQLPDGFEHKQEFITIKGEEWA